VVIPVLRELHADTLALPRVLAEAQVEDRAARQQDDRRDPGEGEGGPGHLLGARRTPRGSPASKADRIRATSATTPRISGAGGTCALRSGTPKSCSMRWPIPTFSSKSEGRSLRSEKKGTGPYFKIMDFPFFPSGRKKLYARVNWRATIVGRSRRGNLRMSGRVIGTVLDRLRESFVSRNGDSSTDAQLLTQFIACRSQNAFAHIVRRHGPMVLGVCQRILGNSHDAEDSFQAAFLVLTLKAAAIRPRERVGEWLHGVALRTALKARTARTRWHARARKIMIPTSEAPNVNGEWDDLKALIDQELAALGENYRSAIVLCDIEGKSRTEAAQQLGWKEGTLSGRLARGRQLLADRLRRRGVALTAAGLATLPASRQLTAQIPLSLFSATIETGTLVAAENLGMASRPVVALTREVLRTMIYQKLKRISLAIAAVLFAIILPVGYSRLRADNPQPQVASTDTSSNPDDPAETTTVDASQLPGHLIIHRVQDLEFLWPPGGAYSRLSPNPIPSRRHYHWLTARLSPNGDLLAFVQGDDSHPPSELKLREIRVATDQREFLRQFGDPTQPKVLVNMPGSKLSNWHWSPDGKSLCFAARNQGDKKYHLHLVEVATQKVEEIKLPALPGNGAEDFGPTIHDWSSDGFWPVLAHGDFYLFRPETKESRRITTEQPGFLSETCRFSHDGKKFCFIGTGKDNSCNLTVIDLLFGKKTIVASIDHRTDFAVCWSPNNRHIAVTSLEVDDNQKSTGNYRVEIFDSAGKEKSIVLAKEKNTYLSVADWR
jgi:RNA polymerase sigma factor (sigma-70 family)